MKFPSLMWARGVALALTVLAPALARAGFQAVHSPDGIDVWAVGDNGGIYRSFDRGLNWTSQTLGAQTLRGVVSRGFNVFVVSDSGKIWRSQNSGGSWSLTVIPGAPRLDAVVMASSEVAFAVGAGAPSSRPRPPATRWFAVTSGTSAALHAVRVRRRVGRLGGGRRRHAARDHERRRLVESGRDPHHERVLRARRQGVAGLGRRR